MSLARAWSDERGVSAVEFGLTAPAFFMLIAGILECGLLLWTQVSLQHAVEMAARCASINPSVCSSTSSIQTYAVQQSFGLNPPPATFAVSAPACGNQVSASYTFRFFTSYFGSPTLALSARSCFPK